MKTKLSALMGIAMIAMLVLTACGSGSGGNSGPITVGELFPMTGREPFVGQWFLHGAKVGIA
ncbi:MAG TPA: hypothetical protein VF099_11545, partial [Ktedonobacterales bacterium]